jgi:hypothetical protein
MRYIVYAILSLVVLGGLYVLRALARAGRRQRENLEAIAAAKTFTADFSTPEGAILCLEEAYRRHDLDAAVACKDFAIEAKLMLQRVVEGLDADDEVAAKTAEVLELAFRKEAQNAWPDFTKSQSFFIEQAPYKDGIVVVTEVCRFTDGGTSRQQILVAETAKGWRVLHPL